MRSIRNSLLGACLITMTLAVLPAQAEDVTSELNPKLRGLLQKEMVGIEAAMKEVYSAIIRGNHKVVQEKGQAIHDSFILAQELTDEDRKALKAAVPKAFLKLDQKFHKQAAKLAEAGGGKDTGKQKQIFDRMTNSCVSCHSRFVDERFSGLKK
ncbi:cytochrome c' [Halospina denitrificans]|uniref:Cytochrome c n=1 Tax=Halospina denitrificans TaxID=332522 RepID=A0A4R7JSF4_9GAMM|nr:cytochrome c [Halospina denitrificans]TDT40267.1 cytochrome c' [Halospina denitrificans]